MNHHHRRRPPPPTHSPPPGLDFQTPTQVLKQASSIFWSHLITFTFLAFLILTFRSNVENGSHLLTAFVDRNPSLRSSLSRLDLPQKTSTTSSSTRRRPFLHLTRIATLDGDLLSGDDDDISPSLNGTLVMLSNFPHRLGFSNLVSDNGIRVSEIVRTGFSVKLTEESNTSDEVNEVENSIRESERVVDLQFLIKGWGLPRRDASALFFLVGLSSIAYGYVIIGFLVTYSWVFGIVFVVVVNHLLGRYRSWIGTIWDGSILGSKRVSGSILMRWAVRDALTQFLGLWFFGEMHDQYSFFKVFLRLKLMPFSIMSPWIRGFEEENTGFMFAWLVMDMIVEFVFAVDYWVAIVEGRRSGREIVKEGCYLLSIMFKQAVTIKCLEFMLCGSFTGWTLAWYLGGLVAAAFQSMIEVYFIVAWLIFYFAVRSKDATSLGRTFGQRELEAVFHGHR
ncbi:hypothetical protein CEY00_Acc08529 [Actinidia chinensis var. chinensis]|uniref:Transmembrane protein n=1 Tax=Actinidia chinensis var. chinensis TaxID=1590841 RepID=A0A2R6R810_ACTCC|nr:hypothetical protein CEY00_Acc08529 [Actinidia chinensis var. chinensis]